MNPYDLKTGDLVVALGTVVSLYRECHMTGYYCGDFHLGLYLGSFSWWEGDRQLISACVIDSQTLSIGWCFRKHVRRMQ